MCSLFNVLMGDKPQVPPFFVLCLFSTLNMVVQRANSINNCAEMTFRGNTVNVVHGTTDKDIRVTFQLVLDNCSSQIDEVFVKVTDQTVTPSVDECRLIYSVNFCDVTRRTSACHCETPVGPAVFSKRFHQPVNVTYLWTWYYLHSDKASKPKVFIISNGSSTHTAEDQKPLLGSVLGGFFFCLFIVASLVFVCCIKRVKQRLAQREARHEQANVTWYRRVNSPCSSQVFDDLPRTSILEAIYNLPPLPADLHSPPLPADLHSPRLPPDPLSHETSPDLSLTEQGFNQDGMEDFEDNIKGHTDYCPDDSFKPKSDSRAGRTNHCSSRKNYPYPL